VGETTAKEVQSYSYYHGKAIKKAECHEKGQEKGQPNITFV
jgi:hypothetical protein